MAGASQVSDTSEEYYLTKALPSCSTTLCKISKGDLHCCLQGAVKSKGPQSQQAAPTERIKIHRPFPKTEFLSDLHLQKRPPSAAHHLRKRSRQRGRRRPRQRRGRAEEPARAAAEQQDRGGAGNDAGGGGAGGGCAAPGGGGV
jgi:hypothetical protein